MHNFVLVFPRECGFEGIVGILFSSESPDNMFITYGLILNIDGRHTTALYEYNDSFLYIQNFLKL